MNQQKSKVSEPVQSTLLGFSFYRSKNKWEIRIAGKSLQRIKQKCKDITQRNNGSNTRQKLQKIAPVIRGWVNYFSIAKAKSVMQTLDECVRTRLRMGLWKEWKNCRTRVANLQNLSAIKQKAYQWGNSSGGYCRVAHSPILCCTLNNGYFGKMGYIAFYNTYVRQTEMQPTLF